MSTCAKKPMLPARSPLALAVSLAVLSPMPAIANESVLQEVTVDAAAESYQVQKLSSPKHTAPLRDTPQSVTVVPQKLLEDQGVTTLRDAFKNISGISITAGEGNPTGGDQLTLRGFSARDDIFIDGARDVGVYARDPFNLERIEISKGPSSTYNGRGSAGGNINQVSKEARLDQFLRGDVTVGDDNTRRVTADINARFKNLENAAFRLNLLAHESEINGRDEIKNDRMGVAASLGLGLGTPTRVTLGAMYMKQDNLPDYGIPNPRNVPAPVGGVVASTPSVSTLPSRYFSNFYGALNRDYEDVDVIQATAKIEHDLNDRVMLRNQLRYIEASVDRVVTAPRFVNAADALNPNDNAPINRSTKPRDQKDALFINQSDIVFRFSDGRYQHAVTTGLEIARQTLDNKRRPDTNSAPGDRVTLGNPEPNKPDAVPVYNGQKVEVETQNIGVYIADTIDFNESWSATAGLRWDYVETEARGINTVPNDEARVSDNTLSYRAGLIYKPRSNGSVYLGYGSSFNPTASVGAASAGIFQPAGGGGAAIENFDAKPEKTTSIELGTKWDVFNERLSLNAALFQLVKENARTAGSGTGTEVRTDGEQEVRGIELGATGQLTSVWEVFAGYTYLDSEIKKSNARNIGKNVDNTPRNTINVWSNFKVAPKMELGVGGYYVSDRTALGSGNNRDVTAPSYLRWDAAASYKLNQNVTLRLNVNNVFNERYIESLGNAQSIPGAERTAYLTASFKY